VSAAYLLDAASELDRLRLQARVWEPEAEALFDRIGVGAGWRCLDVGCGAVGVLASLARRVGRAGRVVGLDRDERLLAAARELVAAEALDNVDVVAGDAFATGLPDGSFDLVHARFMFAPLGREAALLAELTRLTRPGGVVAIEEGDSAAWRYWPERPRVAQLLGAIAAAFAAGGGDFDVGRRIFGMLRAAGFHDVDARAAVLALPGGHPYLALPAQFAASLRTRIVDGGIMSADDLDAAVAECGEAARDPETYATTFVVTQAWGRRAVTAP
jgi:SAM-dependent methyltransferase